MEKKVAYKSNSSKINRVRQHPAKTIIVNFYVRYISTKKTKRKVKFHTKITRNYNFYFGPRPSSYSISKCKFLWERFVRNVRLCNLILLFAIVFFLLFNLSVLIILCNISNVNETYYILSKM